MQTTDHDKEYVASFISNMTALDSEFPDIHCDLLTLLNAGRREIPEDLHNLTVKTEMTQCLCRELSKELGRRFQLDGTK